MLLTTQIIGGPVPMVLGILAAALFVFLLLRRPTPVWLLTAAIGLLAGAVGAVAVFVWADVTDAFEIQLPIEVLWWTVVSFACVGLAVVSMWRSRWWRKVVAGVGVVAFLLVGVVQVNAVFGLDPTVADLLGVTVSEPVALPSSHPHASKAPDQPLYATWKAPADMPKTGKIGTVAIPATVSHFTARPAGLYLPPAALVKNAPALPLMIMMMGYPGSPNAIPTAQVMSAFAAAHHGLAPIVIVADQIGTHGDPACTDSRARGNAATYIKTDVLNWAKQHLNIIHDPRYWTIAGYSNGATCAIKYAAQEPGVFRNVVSISPELYPGSNYSRSVISTVYGGDQAAWRRDMPIAIMDAGSGTYGGVNAIVTTGALDTVFGPESRRLASIAQADGMHVTLLTIPGVAHVGQNLHDALMAGMGKLFVDLGLASPAAAA